MGSVLLLYCPPLLDILPMYVTFLFFTPLVLSAAVRCGWRRILAPAALVWLLAQFGLRDLVHNWVVHVTHLRIPLQETGAFNLFAWQAVWIVGLWLGARSATEREPFRQIPGWLAGLSAAACLFFIGVRYGWLGPHLTQQALGIQLDKWQIGPLRVVNLMAFTVVFYWLRKYVLRVVAIEPFLDSGQSFAAGLLRAHFLRVCRSGAALWGLQRGRPGPAARIARDRSACGYVYRADSCGRRRGAQEACDGVSRQTRCEGCGGEATRHGGSAGSPTSSRARRSLQSGRPPD